jgi:putative oxidoreductase
MSTAGVDVGLLLMRVTIGLVLAAHGYQKVFSGGRIAGTAGWFDSIGMRPGRLHASVAAATEIGAGGLLTVGLLTSLAGAAFVATMLVAGFTVHRRNGFFIVRSGWEYNLVLAVVGAALGTTGAGRYSLDNVFGLGRTFSGLVGAVIAMVGGSLAGVAQLALFYRPPVPASAGGKTER